MLAGCSPPTPDNEGIVCPLYVDETTTFIPEVDDVDCEAVCGEYALALREEDGVELGYTCDATICTSDQRDLILDACLGLEQYSVEEIFKAEFAAGCSCCASQLCNCERSGLTKLKIDELNMKQMEHDPPERTQCEINGTLCGTVTPTP